MSQGSNPWSDLGCENALKLVGRYIVRAVTDASDHEARENMVSSFHLPHPVTSLSIVSLQDVRCHSCGYCLW